MTITISLMCFILVCVMFMQFKTISVTDITTMKNMREAELRTEIASLKNKYEELAKKYEEVNTKRAEYIEKIETNQEASELLEEELNQINMLLGKTEVVGDGIIVTLTDNEEKSIEAYDILQLINELRLAGAEAIAVNDKRIVAMSDVADIINGYIVINGSREVSPFIVKAIGNQSYLESGLTKKTYGYLDSTIKGNGKTATLERKDNIVIPAYTDDITLDNKK